MGRKYPSVVADIFYRDELRSTVTLYGSATPSHRRLVDAVASGDEPAAARLVRRVSGSSIFPPAGRLSSDWRVVCRLES